MEFLPRFLDLAITICQRDLVIPGLATCRTCLESGKWTCVCQTAVDAHIVDERHNATHLCSLIFRLSI